MELLAEEIRKSEAVALHVRWFDRPGNKAENNIAAEYYRKAIDQLEKTDTHKHYFLFSDDPESARTRIDLKGKEVTFISHNRGDENAYADLWLMTQCRHFIIANSTFSWWGAWLAGSKNKIVITPEKKDGTITNWGFEGHIPERWTIID